MNERPTPETDANCYDCEYRGDMGGRFTADAGKLRPDGEHVSADFARNLERQRDEAREQIAASAINTNVRLFDLVRYSRASLHQYELITDEEYAWLCGGAEMANSPKGGSPSPRRLEDYDVLSEQLEAMRATMIATEAYQAGLAADVEAMREAIGEAHAGVVFALTYHSLDGESSLDRLTSILAKLQPFLKP